MVMTLTFSLDFIISTHKHNTLLRDLCHEITQSFKHLIRHPIVILNYRSCVKFCHVFFFSNIKVKMRINFKILFLLQPLATVFLLMVGKWANYVVVMLIARVVLFVMCLPQEVQMFVEHRWPSLNNMQRSAQHHLIATLQGKN